MYYRGTLLLPGWICSEWHHVYSCSVTTHSLSIKNRRNTLTADARLVQSSQPNPAFDLTRAHSRIPTKSGVVIMKTMHGIWISDARLEPGMFSDIVGARLAPAQAQMSAAKVTE